MRILKRHHKVFKGFIFSLLLTFLSIVAHAQGQVHPLKNFNKNGEQVTRFEKPGDAIDAHDGEIAFFKGLYYLYGTSYGCGFEWGHKDAPFCGFKAYSSPDLIHWTDRGQLFDASTPVWQTRCNGNTYGCFRPHVIFNKKTALYVLWINVYDNTIGYRVFTSRQPTGPFVEQAEPVLSVNTDAPVAGLNNGDHDTFVDDDGIAYLASTDWRSQGAIAIEQLDASYLSGTGKLVRSVTATKTEAPALFKRKGIYYLVYSDPNCGYCSGTGASYRTAKSPLGPWSAGIKISDNSCGGQPSFVSTIKLKQGDVFLFGSDLWNNAAKNEALANYYWAPLNFAADGSINKMICNDAITVHPPAAGKNDFAAEKDLTAICDIAAGMSRSQTFTAGKTGLLSKLTISCFKSGYPATGLLLEIFSGSGEKLLFSTSIAVDSISWSPKNILVQTHILLQAGETCQLKISNTSLQGAYGLAYYPKQKDTGSRRFLLQTFISSK